MADMDQRFIEELQAVVGAEHLRLHEPMSRHTTFRVGGPADVMVLPRRADLPQVIRLCKKQEVPYNIFGNGSNLLVGDQGIRGVVIKISKVMDTLSIPEDGRGAWEITAEAGVSLARAANFAAAQGLGGMEFAAGIPGTIGGAVVMNAGAYGGEMADLIRSVSVLTKDGIQKELMNGELGFGYRTSCILKEEYLVLAAVLRLSRKEPTEIEARMKEIRQQRTEKQPLTYPSAGSTFKRPQGNFAGKLIEDAGLAGYQIGGAQVSRKHCGFIVNCGDATAADIRALIEAVQDKVYRQFDIRLEPEVKMVGEF